MTAELPTAAEWVRPVNEVSLRIAAGGRIGPLVIEHRFHLAREHIVTVLVALVHAPALDHTRPDGKAIHEHHRIWVPVPAQVKQLAH